MAGIRLPDHLGLQAIAGSLCVKTLERCILTLDEQARIV
jgi:hypothetical protein